VDEDEGNLEIQLCVYTQNEFGSAFLGVVLIRVAGADTYVCVDADGKATTLRTVVPVGGFLEYWAEDCERIY
jgi:hypothetical protein